MLELNDRFGRPGAVEFVPGNGGLVKVVLKEPDGHVAEIYLQGATVTSWRPPAGPDLLFTSSRAVFGRGKAIRGGIPLVFPQFGPGSLPSHGFARAMEWKVLETSAEQGVTRVSLGLASSEETIVIWPHQFESVITFELGSALRVRWRIENHGPATLTFENALHTYFRVGNIEEVRVEGLHGLDFLDNLNNRSRGLEARDSIAIDEEVDRVYVGAPSRIAIRDGSLGRTILLDKENLTDSVLWNPWIEKSKKLSDFGDDEYREMVCVEAGNIAEPRPLATGAGFECEMVLSYA